MVDDTELATDANRPIETAPKDGSRILIFFVNLGWHAVSWEDPANGSAGYEIWCVDDNKHGPHALRGYSEGDAICWRSLPPEPNGSDQSRQD